MKPTRKPLFITAPSLSSKNPVGVQTKLLLEEVPEWRHLYWDSSDFHSYDLRSTRLESLLFSRLGCLKAYPQSNIAKFLAAAGLSWWRNGSLKPRGRSWLRKNYRKNTSAVYAAVCDARDAERMASVLQVLDRPFILHLWDILDEGQIAMPAFQWLLAESAHVFCLSEAILEQVAPLRSNASILRFRRLESPFFASPPRDGSLRIALIGNCGCYPDGLRMLEQALKIVSATNAKIRVHYIGTSKRLRHLRSALSAPVTCSGFLASDAARDEELSNCHVGFLPGPFAPPATDMLSRYSIPSRILDFLANGLPVLGAVHPDSAAAHYIRKIGLGDCIQAKSPEQLAERLLALANPSTWSDYAALSKHAFLEAQREKVDVNSWLERASMLDRSVYCGPQHPKTRWERIRCTPQTHRSSGTFRIL